MIVLNFFLYQIRSPPDYTKYVYAGTFFTHVIDLKITVRITIMGLPSLQSEVLY